MKTIEDLYEVKKKITKEKNAEGEIIESFRDVKVKYEPQEVSKGIRFAYYLVDIVFFYIFSLFIGVILGFIIVATDAMGLLESMTDPIGGRLWNMLIYVIYYCLFEGILGTSLAKLIFGYVVIDEYANKPSFGRIVGRSFARIIPFEGFSFFGDRGWHDSLSKTYVVKREEKENLRRMLDNFVDSSNLLDR